MRAIALAKMVAAPRIKWVAPLWITTYPRVSAMCR